MRTFSMPKIVQQQSGDTIIEVLLAMCILALVLITTFVSTNRSLQSGVDSSNRQQALALAEQQVELIKTSPSSYQPVGTFCVDNTGTLQTSSANCQLGINNQYNFADTYTAASGLYTVVATWPSTSNAGSKLTVYYRIGL
jgi:Tfp pilus assembly protein PilV